MICITPGATKDVMIDEYPEHSFRVKILPRGLISTARLAISEAYAPYMSLPAEEKESATGNQLASRCFDRSLLASEHLVAYGLDAINGEKFPTVKDVYEGRTLDRMSDEYVDALAHVDHGVLIDRLAGKILAANDLRVEDVLGFKSPSGS